MSGCCLQLVFRRLRRRMRRTMRQRPPDGCSSRPLPLLLCRKDASIRSRPALIWLRRTTCRRAHQRAAAGRGATFTTSSHRWSWWRCGHRLRAVVSSRTRALASGRADARLADTAEATQALGQTLSWLRLSPAPGAVADWAPKVLGSYLNGVWGPELDTDARAPRLFTGRAQTHAVSRAAAGPTKHARIASEGAARRRGDSHAECRKKRSSADRRGGSAWRLGVMEPRDRSGRRSPGRARVCTRRGNRQFAWRWPPRKNSAGCSNSIMAFTYRRTEPGAAGNLVVPANKITTRTSLDLVTDRRGRGSLCSGSGRRGRSAR